MELKGLNLLEFIVELPNFNWTFNHKRENISTKIKKLNFVYYEWRKPRREVDLYKPLDAEQGITLRDLSFIQDHDDERAIGLISKVELGKPFHKEEYMMAHIPLIDFDTDGDFKFLTEEELLHLIKENIRKTTEIERGVILRSGPKRNYHFIGTRRLLSETDFITFLGLCLTMRYEVGDGRINLVDSRHIGHALTPMKYLPQMKTQWKASVYEFPERFSTLRLTPKPSYDDWAKVVEVLE